LKQTLRRTSAIFVYLFPDSRSMTLPQAETMQTMRLTCIITVGFYCDLVTVLSLILAFFKTPSYLRVGDKKRRVSLQNELAFTKSARSSKCSYQYFKIIHYVTTYLCSVRGQVDNHIYMYRSVVVHWAYGVLRRITKSQDTKEHVYVVLKWWRASPLVPMRQICY